MITRTFDHILDFEEFQFLKDWVCMGIKWCKSHNSYTFFLQSFNPSDILIVSFWLPLPRGKAGVGSKVLRKQGGAHRQADRQRRGKAVALRTGGGGSPAGAGDGTQFPSRSSVPLFRSAVY